MEKIPHELFYLIPKRQPLDLSVNRLFKEKKGQQLEYFIVIETHEYTKTGTIKRISYCGIFNCFVDSWNEVQVSCVINEFNEFFNFF